MICHCFRILAKDALVTMANRNRRYYFFFSLFERMKGKGQRLGVKAIKYAKETVLKERGFET